MAGKLLRYAATIIFATREGHSYPVISEKLINKGLSQRQRLAQLYPHVIQTRQLDHARGADVLFVQRTTEAGFMVC